MLMNWVKAFEGTAHPYKQNLLSSRHDTRSVDMPEVRSDLADSNRSMGAALA